MIHEDKCEPGFYLISGLKRLKIVIVGITGNNSGHLSVQIHLLNIIDMNKTHLLVSKAPQPKL